MSFGHNRWGNLEKQAKVPDLNPKRELLARWKRMQNEMSKVLELWCACESLGYEVPAEDYPFEQSFDDMLHDCFQYQEQLEKWAMKGKSK